jgi:hypothetical protein
VSGEFFTDILEVGLGGDDVQDTIGDACTFCKLLSVSDEGEGWCTYLHDGQVGVGSFGWDLDDGGTSCGDDWGYFSCYHSGGEVPSIMISLSSATWIPGVQGMSCTSGPGPTGQEGSRLR